MYCKMTAGKARIVEPEETTVSSQRFDKIHSWQRILPQQYMNGWKLFPVRVMPGLYDESHRKSKSWKNLGLIFDDYMKTAHRND